MSAKIIKIKKKKVEPVINIKNQNNSNIKNNKQPELEEDISIAYKPIDDISNKISNFVNKNDEMIEPLSWVLPNKKEFINWISQTFFKYRADGKKLPAYKGFKPFKYQKLLRDYMQNNSPYRGILLYHGLGVGKTCSSIIIAEKLKTQRNVVVMLPASLKNNFITDGLMFCGDSKYKTNPELYKEKYTFISYNASNTTTQLKRIGSLDNKVIIIDEVHNLISKIISGLCGISKQGRDIYNFLMSAQNAKIVAMSGTPLVNDPFELAVLFNILRGYIEILYFRIINVSSRYGNTWELNNLELKLSQLTHVDYVKINKVNKSIEFHLKVKSYTEEYRETIEKINSICNDEGVEASFLEIKNLELFPTDDCGEIFRNYFIHDDVQKGDKLKNADIFKRRILGLVSFYKSTNDNYPDVVYKDFVRVDMSPYQYQIYEILRKKERLTERGGGNKKKKGTIKGTFRVFSRQACNFVFPDEINRPYPDPAFVVSLKSINDNNSKAKNKKFNKLLEIEENANENGIMAKEYKERIQHAISLLVEEGNKYFKPGPEGLDKLSPKMKVMLENVNKSPGLVFIYSNFRTLEGVEIFSKVLDFNGYEKYNSQIKGNSSKPKYAIYSGLEDELEKNAVLKVFTSNENKNGELIKIILATSAGAEGLDLKNIRQIHVLEPYWNQVRIEQVIGRGVRRNSHMALPEKDRNVEVYRYFSVISNKNMGFSKEPLSTDEYMDNVSRKKQYIIDELQQILKECAFDCILNSADIKGDGKCFSFGEDAEGLAYLPSLASDLVHSRTRNETKTKKISYIKAVYCDGFVYLIDAKKKIFYLYNDDKKDSVVLDIKKCKPIYVNKETNDVYDTKSIESGNPLKIGNINKDNKIVKKK
jgi:superfamily II DNA or RNA helicase